MNNDEITDNEIKEILNNINPESRCLLLIAGCFERMNILEDRIKELEEKIG